MDAEIFCEITGGNLASIHSDAEHTFIKNYINQVTGAQKPSWIGGSDAMEEGTWMWSDGSKFNYKIWNVGEPNNSGGAENCLLMNSGAANWNDAACTYQASFVCSKNSV
ncbi:galactose-specific lectin nattectin-like [Sander lucioperca]|uniref:galactose-specific lectin nattectin-like n=1 Tax=Sander lucioperca TaxID=283035 RepID=UPI001653DEA4|nr:galactose-specific lectin nattectin-like [Sander lucioperca]